MSDDRRNNIGTKHPATRSIDAAYILLISVLWLAAVFAVNPRGEFPVTDDWGYTPSVRIMLESGRLWMNDFNAATFFTQIFWGSLFGAVFGPSNLVLRISTLVAAWLGAIAFYRLLRLNDSKPEVATVATIILLFNPLSFLFAFSFMTDIPYTALQIAAMWMLALGALTATRWPRLLGWIFGVAALLIRQVGFAVPVGVAGEAILRRRLTLRHVGAALLPLLLFVAVQMLFDRWLRSIHAEPSLHGYHISRMLVTLSHPLAAAYSAVTIFFQCALYLGFFLLPVSIMAVDTWRPLLGRAGAWGVAVAAAAGSVAALAIGLRFPTWFNSLQRSGLGQDITGSMTPEWVAIPLTILAMSGTVLMFAGIFAAAYGWYRRPRAKTFDITVFALVIGACLLAPLPFIFLRMDRYLIPVLPCALIVLADAFRSQNASRRAMGAGVAAATVMVLLSVACMHDYMAAKRAQWTAFTDLTRSVPADHIDAGWVINGPTSYGKHGQRLGMLGWFAADDYAIDSEMHPGFRVIARYPVASWLPWGWTNRPILVQEKIAGKSAVAK